MITAIQQGAARFCSGWDRLWVRAQRTRPTGRVTRLPGITATAATLPAAKSLIGYYYDGLRISLPYYAGGYFWWNYDDGQP